MALSRLTGVLWIEAVFGAHLGDESKGHAQSVISTDGLCVNLDSKTVEIDGARVHLTGKEYQMLELWRCARERR